MIKILDRYLLRSFLVNYLLSLFVLVSLYVVLDLSMNSDEFTEKGEGLFRVVYNICDYYFFNIPLYFAYLSGVITLFAACATLARLHRQHEVTAVLASGTGLYRLVAPIILAGVALNGLLVFDTEMVLPAVAPKLARARDNVEGAHAYDLWFVKDSQERLLSAREFSPKEQQIAGLIVLERFNDPADPFNYRQLKAVTTAYRARWDEKSGLWRFPQGGQRYEIGRQVESGTGLGVDSRLEPVRVASYQTDLSPANLVLRKSAQWLDFLSLRQLTELERRGEADPARAARIRHSRFTLPISNMVLLLLGLPFFMNRLPGNVLSQGAKALGLCTIAFLTIFLGQHVPGPAGSLLQDLPPWLPIFVFGPIAVLLLDNVKT
jgi:lipopolysaccharide export system permease protein